MFDKLTSKLKVVKTALCFVDYGSRRSFVDCVFGFGPVVCN